MALFVMTCLDQPGGLENRLKHRPAHIDYVAKFGDMIRVAGPVLDDAGDMAGSLFIVEAADRAQVEAFSAQDPFVLHGVFASVQIRGFRRTLGPWGA